MAVVRVSWLIGNRDRLRPTRGQGTCPRATPVIFDVVGTSLKGIDASVEKEDPQNGPLGDTAQHFLRR